MSSVGSSPPKMSKSIPRTPDPPALSVPVALKVIVAGESKESEKYIPLVAAGHEMMRVAANLADEIRELEKAGDAVLRNPHVSKGKVKTKTALMDKPK